MSQQKTIAVTMGDPAGIGPEIICKAFAAGAFAAPNNYVVIGDAAIIKMAAVFCGLTIPLKIISSIKDASTATLNVLDQKQITPGDFTIGHISMLCGKAAFNYITCGIRLALQKEVDALVTCPINKEALKKAGVPFPGHTEILMHQTGAAETSMVFYLDDVAVAHVTTHCSLRAALDLISKERVLVHIRVLDALLKRMGNAQPRIAVGGLNPHAGEHGMFGNEEQLHIEPAIKSAQSEAIEASGPYPPDTVFMRAFKGEFDGIVSMLHDHGFVALKSRDFQRGVNITAGLPIIRTSVGHGTAFDIAGKGISSEESLNWAIKIACRLVETI
ncbi:MAG: 4-hydroxythreonine-4-phosphate dehydrogenase PdxA [Chitinivibrionales bacterium]|nr:4-hydroxythreonine-4-phosphate dehydrogenase PdxA [Chitinivibrionales bacterium]